MGSSGPDLFFFAPDYDVILYPSILLPFANDVVQPIRDIYENVIAPVTDIINDVEEGVEVVMDELTCNALSTVTDRVDAINESLADIRDSFMVYIFSESINMFDLMRPPLQKGEDEKSWYWFDMLHYRRTGDFLQKMWDNSDTDEQKAYVLGYATHVAADVAGHPYVNQVVGGPARAHNQRHHFIENIMDVWFYDQGQFPSVNITNAKLHQQLPHGEELDDEGILFAVLEGSVEIKDDLQEIFEMVSQSLNDIFEDEAEHEQHRHPTLTNLIDELRLPPNGIPSPEDINLAYWLFLSSLKVSTDSFIPRPEEPLESTLEDIVRAVEEFLDNVSNPPTPPSSRPDTCFALWSDDCDFSLEALEEWIKHLWDNIAYLGELIAWAVSVLKDLLDILVCTITAPLKAAVSSLLWLIHSALYSILEEIRDALVLAAIVHPQPEWVKNHPLAQETIELTNHSWNKINEKLYPQRAQESNEGFLKYPETSVEKEPTVSGPYPAGSTPAAILTGIGAGNFPWARMAAIQESPLELYKRYANSESPANTICIEDSTKHHETLPAIPLALIIFNALREDGEKIPDWNLDADRGYHYKNWTVDDWERLSTHPDHNPDPNSSPIDEQWHQE